MPFQSTRKRARSPQSLQADYFGTINYETSSDFDLKNNIKLTRNNLERDDEGDDEMMMEKEIELDSLLMVEGFEADLCDDEELRELSESRIDSVEGGRLIRLDQNNNFKNKNIEEEGDDDCRFDNVDNNSDKKDDIGVWVDR